jgi:hypothetical protein
MQPATLCYVDFASLAQCSSSVADFIASGKSRNFLQSMALLFLILKMNSLMLVIKNNFLFPDF